VGSIIGCLAGVGIGYLLVHFLIDITLVLSPGAIPIGLILGIGVGAIFGLYPAIKAKNLDPGKALRYE
jgi:putative ABC transport system permease protein